MHFIGIEIGHGGTRAVALDLEAAAIRAEAWVPHDWIEGLPAGYREQNPGTVDRCRGPRRPPVPRRLGWRSRTAWRPSAWPVRGGDWCCSMRRNRIIRPAKLAGDISVKRQADEIARAFGGAPGLIELAGQAPGVDSAAAECLWLKQHEPYHFQRAANFLTAQDFIAYWLTGERATEAGSASGTGLLDIRSRSWSAELLDFIDPGLASRLPPIRPSDQPRGLAAPGPGPRVGACPNRCRSEPAAPRRCLPRWPPAAWWTARWRWSSAATGVIAGVGAAPVIDYRGEITSLCNATGSWLGLATTANAAVAPEVLRRHYGWTAAEFESMVASVSPGADGLLMLPYFTGESIPRLPDGTGVLHGITAGKLHTRPHGARRCGRAWRSAWATP